jgi:hypothetical protein
LPLYFAFSGLPILTLGKIQSAALTGDLLGFIALPIFSKYFYPRELARIGDILAIFSAAILGICFHRYPSNTLSIAVAAAMLSFSIAIWFANSDGSIVKILGPRNSEKFHHELQIALNAGQLIGPTFAAFTLKYTSIASICLINAMSFGVQLFNFSKFTGGKSSKAEPTDSSQKKMKTLKRFYERGFLRMSESPILLSQTLVSVCFKFSALMIPYCVHLCAKSHGNQKAAILATCAGAGMILSAMTYKRKGDDNLGAGFFASSSFMAFFGLLFPLLTSIAAPIPLIGVSFFFWGYNVSRYQIFFRSVRQRVEAAEDFPSIVALQGLAVRLPLPLAGLLFPVFFADKDIRPLMLFSSILSITILAASARLKGNFAVYAAQKI